MYMYTPVYIFGLRIKYFKYFIILYIGGKDNRKDRREVTSNGLRRKGYSVTFLFKKKYLRHLLFHFLSYFIVPFYKLPSSIFPV